MPKSTADGYFTYFKLCLSSPELVKLLVKHGHQRPLCNGRNIWHQQSEGTAVLSPPLIGTPLGLSLIARLCMHATALENASI